MKTSLTVFTVIMLSTLLSACGGGSSSQSNKNSTRPTPTPTATPVVQSTPTPTATPSATPSQKKNIFEGVFQLPAYGEIIQIKLNGQEYDAKQFSYTTDNCILFSETKLKKETINNISTISDSSFAFTFNKDMELSLRQKGSVFSKARVYKRLDKLPDTCDSKLLPRKGENGYKFDANRDFKFLWDRYKQFYVDFSLSKTNWDKIYTKFKPRTNRASNEEELFKVFSDMVEPLGDGHVSILQGSLRNGARLLLCDEDAESFNEPLKTSLIDTLAIEFAHANPDSLEDDNENFTDEGLKKATAYIKEQKDLMLKTVKGYANDPKKIKTHVKKGNENNKDSEDSKIVSFITPQNIGYIEIPSMTNFTESVGDTCFSDFLEDSKFVNRVIDQVLTEMQDTKGIIIDVRRNSGGSEEIALNIMSRFIATRTHTYSQQERLGSIRTPLEKIYVTPQGERQYLKPVVVLTSNDTFSAAETFTLAMKSRPNTTLIGTASGGGFSTVLFDRVTSDIAFTLSNEIVLSPDGKWYEHRGIPVNIKATYGTKEQRQANRDLGIEGAIKFLSR